MMKTLLRAIQKAPGHVERAARLSFDRAPSAPALISILGACHTLNTM